MASVLQKLAWKPVYIIPKFTYPDPNEEIGLWNVAGYLQPKEDVVLIWTGPKDEERELVGMIRTDMIGFLGPAAVEEEAIEEEVPVKRLPKPPCPMKFGYL
jgi:hypothetical protein